MFFSTFLIRHILKVIQVNLLSDEIFELNLSKSSKIKVVIGSNF